MQNKKIKKVKVGDFEFDVVLADNFIKRGLGLMLRDIGDKAMLFLYKRRKITMHTFFMLYPIDVIFIDKDMVVEAVRLKPWKSYKCKNYSTAMLEFKCRDAELNKLIGEKVEFMRG
ncbi:hypothetical protein JH146_0350 [Methanocaldococcus bathoardescens]|uniref:DUF192 domain-containing protein n=1 Tax=Methanocaldococcus bathoardescens TaxID=1301915 RepID=A0A076LA25_9EURY|nr:DUF192 domain-containing protein [Methanocaldococcus bathoardescens]AIJ05200.1 hypothetical protein JH146_0350 [Methanocaldococcus bathoardescens]